MFQHREKIRRARKVQEARANAAKAAAEAASAAGEAPFGGAAGGSPFGQAFNSPNDYTSLLSDPDFLEAIQVQL